jgi:hypothetical protein
MTGRSADFNLKANQLMIDDRSLSRQTDATLPMYSPAV